MILIRKEQATDYDAIQYVNDQAFNQPQEGNVIRKIRETGADILSLVAEMNNEIIGHIFFSEAALANHPEVKNGMGLAPMAVLPQYQQQGIGKMLIKKGIELLKERDIPYVIVLGHETYYPKFGFEKASKYGLISQWDEVPDEAFMIMILDKNLISKISGIAKYRDEWNEAM
ncbi:MAG TPA: N-acetyltransferase [Chryseobacterium sp.]|nr:N-acetyltransferase [Chryseobacterium sp.]